MRDDAGRVQRAEIHAFTERSARVSTMVTKLCTSKWWLSSNAPACHDWARGAAVLAIQVLVLGPRSRE